MQKGWSARELGFKTPLIADEWYAHSNPGQYPFDKPPTWLVMGGRGSGKTRLGAEWINGLVRAFPPFAQHKHLRIALVGETLADVRDVMIEGPSGILTTSRYERPRFEVTRRRILWSSGAVAHMFSSEDPESLRGPQFEAAWGDEIAKWKNAEDCFDMLQFGLRLGQQPRQLLTTTPRPVPLMKRLIADASVGVTRLRTEHNVRNLADGFTETLRRRYSGSVLERQELDGELIEDRRDALWSRGLLDQSICKEMPEIRRIVVAIDPPASSTAASDACGIVAAGLAADGRAVVLEDATVRAAGPQQWAMKAVSLFHRLNADCLVAEINQGGDMVTAVIRTVDADVPVKTVRAKRAKWLRAEPIAALYQQGKVLHPRHFPELEDEMCDFGSSGLSNGRSPDRLDALVWAVGELMPEWQAQPRIRDFS